MFWKLLFYSRWFISLFVCFLTPYLPTTLTMTHITLLTFAIWLVRSWNWIFFKFRLLSPKYFLSFSIRCPFLYHVITGCGKKVVDDKPESVYYYYYKNLSYNNDITVGPVTSGANVLISNSAHFSFNTIHENITFNVSCLYEIHFKDGYKGPPNNVHLNPSGVSSNINFVNIEDTSGKWFDINHPFSITINLW